MEKTTEYDRIEIMRDGTVQVRLRKIIVDEDGVKHQVGGNDHFHRVVLQPGVLLDGALLEAVNANLVAMGSGAIDAADLAEIEATRSAAQTPEKIAAFHTRRVQEAAKESAVKNIAFDV